MPLHLKPPREFQFTMPGDRADGHFLKLEELWNVKYLSATVVVA